MSLCTPSVLAQGKASDSDFLKDYDKVVVPQSVEDNAARNAIRSAPKPAASAKSGSGTIMLKGRLEEVSGNGANLPVGLLLKLKSQTAKSDPALQPKPKADPLKGLLATYPTDWAGPWGGSLSVWWTQIDPLFWQWDPQNAKATAEILKRGSSGTTTFNFVQNGTAILVQPPKIVFPPRQSQSTENVPSNNPMASLQAMLLNSTIPVVVLGDYSGQGLVGTTLNQRVVKNTIKQLKPGVLEQDVVCQTSERQQDNAIKNSYVETVYRFTKLNSSQLYVQAATVSYRNDGHFLDKVIYYGTLNRGQVMPDPSSNPFAGMPSMPPGMGSFPGMPTSPGGGNGMPSGLDGLNDVIRELQKGLGQ
jgi:hypothetical protein